MSWPGWTRPSIEQTATWMAGSEAGHDKVVYFFGGTEPGTVTASPVGTRVALLRLIIQ